MRHGSVLSVTSYATRTSPVIRGVYVLENIFGAPPPPPLPNVPALDESTVSATLPMRERLAAHRNNAVCASCHRTIDPVGFSLESFNAVGQWRDYEGEGEPIDASGALPGVGEFRGVAGLEDALLSRPELFAGTLTEKLLTFALGRGVEYYDAPAVRKIVRDAGKDRYRFSSLILGIVKALPFQMRRAAARGEGPRKRSDASRAGRGPPRLNNNEEIIVMIITKKALPRRTFLKGAQAALALPLLDAMIPAATAWAQTPAKPVPGSASCICPWGAITRVGRPRSRTNSPSFRRSCSRSNRSKTT